MSLPCQERGPLNRACATRRCEPNKLFVIDIGVQILVLFRRKCLQILFTVASIHFEISSPFALLHSCAILSGPSVASVAMKFKFEIRDFNKCGGAARRAQCLVRTLHERSHSSACAASLNF
jgi:hypothetical protein